MATPTDENVLRDAKELLRETQDAAGMSNKELARRLGTVEGTVRRLRDPLQRSHIGTIDKALQQFGFRLDVSLKRL